MRFFVALAASAAVVTSSSLSIRYEPESRWRVEARTEFQLETLSMEMTRDGEPMENRRGGAGGRSTSTREVVLVDEVVSAEGGRPVEVRRTFETVSGKGSSERGDRSNEFDEESPFDGLVLGLSVGEDGCEAEVLEGDAPEADEALEGHRAELALAGLLPAESVELEESWDVEGDALRAALGLDLEGALFPRPERAEGGGGGDRRGGGRGGRGGRGSASLGRLLADLDWSGGGKLVALDHDHDGQEVARITLELEGRGELEERAPGGGGEGRRRGDREFVVVDPLASRLATTVSVEIEGELLFSLEQGRPLSLELRGKIDVERDTEREMRGSVVNIRSTEEGQFTHVVTLTPGS